MTLEHQAILCGFASSLGEPEPIVPNDADDLSNEIHAILMATGLQETLRVSNLESNIRESVSNSLERSQLKPADIDCVIIATKRDSASEPAMDKDVREILFDLGIQGASVFGLDRIACANSLLAMCTARMMVENGAVRNCLILSYNKMRDGESRLMKPSIGFLSEGVASCVVTRQERPGYRLGAYRIRSDLKLQDNSAQGDLLTTFRTIGRNIRELGELFYADTGLSPEDFDLAILNNLSFSTMRLFSGQLDMPWNKVYKELVPKTSHLSGCDIVVNLEHIDTNCPELIGEKTMIFSNSAIDWVVCELSRIQ